MPRSFGLGAYRVQFKESRKRKGELEFGPGFDVLGLHMAYFHDRKNQLIDLADHAESEQAKAREDRALRVIKASCNAQDATITGVIESGEYGIEAPLVDRKTAKERRKQRDEAEMRPFYFLGYFPEGATAGLMLFERIGRWSPKGVFIRDFKRYLTDRDFTVAMNAITSQRALEEYLTGGSVMGVRTRSWRQSGDARQVLTKTRIAGEPIENGTEVKVEIRHCQGLLGKIGKELLGRIRRNKSLLDGLVEVHGLDRPDEIQVEVENEEGSRRVFSITRPDDNGMSFDVTDDISIGSDGLPTWASIDRVAREIMNDLARASLF